ncbi:MAG TPA: oligosaccharide flippase family protein [Candidatus Pristimantibacillus sp.]|nr:oligosaccharide flippase family protein [Candidatus Pristimantibacillus sp.]
MSVVQKLRHSQFLLHNTVFFLGSVAVGALNYLYYPVLGRLLEPRAFGEVQTLVSLFLQLTVFLTVLSMVIVNIVANQSDETKRNGLIFEFEKLALWISAALLAASIIFGKQLQHWLNFGSPWPFAVLMVAILVSVPFILRGAYLRGLQRFGMVSSGNILAAGGKLVLSAILVAAGLGTLGAIGGVAASQVVACALILWWARRLGLERPHTSKKISHPNLKLLAPELRFGGVVLAASLAITLQYSVDIIFIKHYFDPNTAGLYAGVAAVARILFFLTASVAQVLMSKIKLDGRGHDNHRMLEKSLFLLGAISLPVLAVMILLPTQVINLLMGSGYQEMANLLPILSTSVFIVSVINLLATYYLSLRRYGVAAIAVLGAAFTYFLILMHHSSPEAVVSSLLWGSAATLAVLGGWKITERRYGV